MKFRLLALALMMNPMPFMSPAQDRLTDKAVINLPNDVAMNEQVIPAGKYEIRHLTHPGGASVLSVAEEDAAAGLPSSMENRYQTVLAARDLDSPESLALSDDLNRLAQEDLRRESVKRVESMAHALLAASRTQATKGYAAFEVTLGIALTAEGKLKDAALAFRDSLRIREGALEPSRLSIAESLNNLALVNRKLHRLNDSERDYRRAIEILRGTKRQPELAGLIHNLARVRAEQGHKDEAQTLIQEAIGIWQESLGPTADEVAEGYATLGLLYQSEKRYADSVRANRRALEIFAESRHANDVRLLVVLKRFSSVLRVQEEYAEAAKIDLQAMRIRVANSLR